MNIICIIIGNMAIGFKKTLVSLFLLSAFLFVFSVVLAQETSNTSRKTDINISVNLESQAYTAGGNISGVVTFLNNDNHGVSGLRTNYILFLLPSDVNPAQFTSEDLKPFDIIFDEELFSLKGGEEISFPLNYSIPGEVPSGDYRLEIGLTRDEVTDEKSKLVKLGEIKGQASFVDAESASVLRNGKEYPGGVGVSFEPGENAICRIDLENNTGRSLSLSPRVISYLRFIGGDVVSQDGALNLIMGPDEKRGVNIKLPTNLEPQSYISTIQFVSDEGFISSITACRWIVRGESASIILFEFDKNTYNKGDLAKADIFITGPADLIAAEEDHELTGLGEVELNIKVTDVETGVIVGEVKNQVEIFDILDSILEVPITESTGHYKALLTVSKDGKVLASAEIENEPGVGKSGFEINYVYVLVVLILLIIIAYFSKSLKDKDKNDDDTVQKNEKSNEAVNSNYNV